MGWMIENSKLSDRQEYFVRSAKYICTTFVIVVIGYCR